MRVAAIQHDIVWEDAPATRAHVTPLIEQAADAGADLIVLTEMFATGFSMRPERIAEDEGGPSEQFLLERAARHRTHLIASIAQRGADGAFRNNAVVAGPDGVVGRYAKIHPFSYAGEHTRYAAGDRHLTIRIGDLRVTVFICYDLRFADDFWATATDTDVYVVPANWPAVRREHWQALLPARAIENQAYVIGVNRVGLARDTPHAGDSVILDPLGRVLAASPGPQEAASPGPQQDEAVLLAEITAKTVERIRTEYPFLADRRQLSG